MRSSWTANLVAILVGAALPLVVACSGDEGAQPAGEVAALQDCPPPQCIPRAEATRQLGFPVYEPHDLPEDYSLYSRSVRTPRIGQSLPGADPSRATPGEAPPTLASGSLPAVLQLEYRFNRSLNVPGVLVSESAHAPPGTAVQVRPTDDSCGDVIDAEYGSIVYFSGPVELEPGANEGEWLACKVEEAPQRDFHTVLLTRGHVLIELVAFPEGGVSKAELIRMAESLAEAE